MTTKPNHAPMIIERALMAHRIDRFFIAKSFLRGDWIVIHRGQIIDRAQKHEIAITKTTTPAATFEEKGQ